MPSPKWKLVVDIGDTEETAPVPAAAVTAASNVAAAPNDAHFETEPLKESLDMAMATATVASAPVASANVSETTQQASFPPASVTETSRDSRVDEVVSLLGEFMPSDPTSPLAAYLSGFVSLRLLLLRPARSPAESELTGTILESYSSYSAGGRERSDIAVMLARDFMFLSQQQQQQQPPLLNLGQNMMSQAPQVSSSNSGLSLFGLPSTSSSLQNSPALTPIPVPGSNDSMSIVSN